MIIPVHIEKWHNKYFLNKIREAIDDYDMISENDRVLVAVSGGKDSILLAYSLAMLSKYSHVSFIPVFTHIDYGFGSDFSEVIKMIKLLGFEIHIEKTDLSEKIDFNHEKNPCYLCAKLRRGALVRVAKDKNCTKIAFGHHLDDAVETFLMNLFTGGQIASFKPYTKDDKSQLTSIRPMIYLEEEKIIKSIAIMGLPVVKSNCTYESSTARSQMKESLTQLKTTYPKISTHIINGLQTLSEKNAWQMKKK